MIQISCVLAQYRVRNLARLDGSTFRITLTTRLVLVCTPPSVAVLKVAVDKTAILYLRYAFRT
jgi:hypothetical protein